MNEAPDHNKITMFLREVFGILDRTIPFDQRPTANFTRWESSHPPFIQILYPQHILENRGIEQPFVTIPPFSQVYVREEFITAAVGAIQHIDPETLPDAIIIWIDTLVDSYKPSIQADERHTEKTPPADTIPEDEANGET